MLQLCPKLYYSTFQENIPDHGIFRYYHALQDYMSLYSRIFLQIHVESEKTFFKVLD
jgi:hypothetical protein